MNYVMWKEFQYHKRRVQEGSNFSKAFLGPLKKAMEKIRKGELKEYLMKEMLQKHAPGVISQITSENSKSCGRCTQVFHCLLSGPHPRDERPLLLEVLSNMVRIEHDEGIEEREHDDEYKEERVIRKRIAEDGREPVSSIPNSIRH